jgi:putative ABC transport system permease protein
MSQILSESMVLTTLAGMAGISFAVFVLQMMEIGNAQSETPAHFQISFWMAIGACAILLILGMLAGLTPAYRAMAIKPIEAIRDE